MEGILDADQLSDIGYEPGSAQKENTKRPDTIDKTAPYQSSSRLAACGREAAKAAVVDVAAMTHAKGRHRIDPRVSVLVLVLLNVVSFATTSRLVEVTLVALVAVLMIWCGKARMALSWVLGYSALTGIYLVCMMAGPFLMPVGTCFLMFCKIFPTAMFAALMIATTYAGELACGLQQWGLSSRFTVALCVALRFFPTIGTEAKAVTEAMKTRGIRLTPLAIIRQPVAMMEMFMVPFIHRLSIVADELGNAVTARGVDTTRSRTSLYELKIRAIDVLVLGVTVVVLAYTLGAAIL